MVLKTKSNVSIAIIKLITASIRETRGVFLYNIDERIIFVISIHKEITHGINIAQGCAILGSPQGS